MPKKKKGDLKSDLAKLSELADWFEKREVADIEDGLKKIKEAGDIIKRSNIRLKEIENEFEEIKDEIEKDLKR